MDVLTASVPLTLPDYVSLCHQMILELLNTLHREQRTNAGLQQQLEQLLKRLYGPRGEKFDAQAHALFPELKALLDQPAPPSTVPAVEAPSAPKKASTGRRQLPSSLRREQHRYEVPEDQRQCPQCKVTCQAFSEEITEQLDYIPANLFVHVHIRCKYACPQCRAHVVTAPKPAQPIDKGLPAAGLIAHIAVCKYSDHVPLHRQEQIFARTDDTRVSMQDKSTPGKTTSTRFWTYVGDDEHPLTVFDFTLSRQRDGPASFLKGYLGAIQADGYSAYDGIAISGNNPRGGCWAHARRHFHDTVKTAPPTLYADVMARIGRLFAIERDIKERLEAMTTEQGHPVVGAAADAVRLQIRQHRTVPELTALRHFLNEQKKDALPKSPWGQAVNYALNQWDDLSLFTTLGSLAIDNNVAERSLRGIALGRKNWLFVDSPQRGQTAAILFSVLASCKRHDVEPRAYLKDVLQRLALPATPEELRQLFPHRWKSNHVTK